LPSQAAVITNVQGSLKLLAEIIAIEFVLAVES